MDKPAGNQGEIAEAVLAALGRASGDKLDAFLDEQIALARRQSEDLRDDHRLRHWRARIEHWSGILKLSFEIAVAVLALLAVIGVGAAIWSAAHDKALVIEPFSVPPELAARGLDGKAIAAHLQDRLAVMQAATQSVRPADSYSNDWGNDIKVQIPETGVSIGEVYRLLVAWLGHQTHITGEVWATAGGLAITTRAGGDGATTVTGTEADLDGLLQQAAESVYRRTQPYRYAVYLLYRPNPPWARVREIYEDLAATGSRRERAWAYVGLSNVDSNTGNDARAIEELHQAVADLPSFALPYQNLESEEVSLGHEEAALRYADMAVRVLPDDREIARDERAAQLPLTRGEEYLVRSDYAAALRDYDAAIALSSASSRTAEVARLRAVLSAAFLHDAAGVKDAYQALPPSTVASVLANRDAVLSLAGYALGEWSVLTADFTRLQDDIVKSAKQAGANDAVVNDVLDHQVRPFFAVALAMNGDLAKAHAMVNRTPLDCDSCLRARGRIAAHERRWGAAQYWFERAVRHAPSIALGYSDWGAMLLAKGDFDDAIAKLAAAHDRSPHFADPLEMWGEALTAEDRSDLALARFEEAARYAPNWGRLHLKWGEALLWLGRKDAARAEFARAARLSLSPAERRELATVSH